MPTFEGATEWFNGTQAHAEAETRQRPTLVHFWSVSCGICKDNLPRVAQWRDRDCGNTIRSDRQLSLRCLAWWRLSTQHCRLNRHVSLVG